MTGPNSIVIAEPEGGHGGYVWERIPWTTNTYRIRRGMTHVARITLHETLPFHSALLEGICRVLDEAERVGM